MKVTRKYKKRNSMKHTVGIANRQDLPNLYPTHPHGQESRKSTDGKKELVNRGEGGIREGKGMCDYSTLL